jgi:hypothetical protein
MPTPASAGRLGKLFNADIPRKLSKSFGNFVVNINRYIAIRFAFS